MQHAVWRNGGLGSSEILFNFATVALVPAALETRHCCQAAASLYAIFGQCVVQERITIIIDKITDI